MNTTKIKPPTEKMGRFRREQWLRGQVPVRFFMPIELAEQMRAQAKSELLTVAAWVKQSCRDALRRKKAAA